MNKAVFINTDNNYIAKSIVSLKSFLHKNNDYIPYIIGKNINKINKDLCNNFQIKVLNVDLSKDFNNLDKRKYGKKYPLECFYHFYAYKLLSNYDYIVGLEPDIFTNKKFDFEFDKINYISVPIMNRCLIKNYNPIMKDFNIIKKYFNQNYNIEQNKLSSGLKIFNVKKCFEINFYEKIVDYYKKSFLINCQRCGDDSLFTLFQIFNEKYFYYLPNEYCIDYNSNNLSLIEKIYSIHFIGSLGKYWDINLKKTGINKFYNEKVIEYIYNNFSNQFIKKYYNKIYKNIENVKLKLYYYNIGNNFGDCLLPYFMNKYCKNDFEFVNDKYNKKKIISVGSIMRLSNNKTIVYGSGIRDIDQNIVGGINKIVRGPLTRKRLLELNYECPPVYGDPGLLLPFYYNPTIEKKFLLGIVPHVSQYEKIYSIYKSLNMNKLKIIDLRNNVEKVINDLLSCRKIVSSSLHGLIVSDAYNIPNKWIKFDNNIKGDDTKFYDYFKSVNRKDQTFINCLNYKKKMIKELNSQIKNVDINFDFKQLKENMFFDEKGIKPYTKYLFNNL